MKVCLSSRQTAQYLAKADEIKVQYRDRKIIPDLADKYPKAVIILKQDPAQKFDFEELEKYKILTRDKLILCLANYSEYKTIKLHNIPFYMGYPIQSFYELKALKELGVCYVLLGAPLFFMLEKVKACGIPVRAIPNVGKPDGIPRTNEVMGTWIRPEDIDAYGDYISIIEFEHCDQTQEQGLYRIYCESKEWKVELGLLIDDLNYPGNNRLISSMASRNRMNCGQKCIENGTCSICWFMLKEADKEKLEEYKKSK